jgi:hypothetical protein
VPVARTLKRLIERLHGRAEAARELFVHEDDWGRIEVLPASAAEWCAREHARIRAFAAAHEAPDGGGWTDIYMRSAPPVALAEMRIPFAEACAAMRRQLAAFDVVASGTFSAPEPVPRVRGFGAANTGIIVVPDRDGACVAMISLVLNGADGDCAAVVAALGALVTPEPLVLVDWARGCIVPLADALKMRAYVQGS